MTLINSHALDQATAAFHDALDRHGRHGIHGRVGGWVHGRAEEIVKALLDNGWPWQVASTTCAGAGTPPTRGGIIHVVVRGQTIHLVIEDAESGAQERLTGTVTEISGIGPVNLAHCAHVRSEIREPITAANST